MKLPKIFRKSHRPEDVRVTAEQDEVARERGYPWHFRPIDHHLPAGIPSEPDLLLIVERQVEALAQGGGLDAGTPFVVDREIDRMVEAWVSVITQDAGIRDRTIRAIIADQAGLLARKRSQLAQARESLGSLTREVCHYKASIDGHPVAPLPQVAPQRVDRALIDVTGDILKSLESAEQLYRDHGIDLRRIDRAESAQPEPPIHLVKTDIPDGGTRSADGDH